MREWFAIACSASVVRRSCKVALVVGTVLVAINHGDHLLAGRLAALDWLKIGLTYCVPYCVATYSATSALRARR